MIGSRSGLSGSLASPTGPCNTWTRIYMALSLSTKGVPHTLPWTRRDFDRTAHVHTGHPTSLRTNFDTRGCHPSEAAQSPEPSRHMLQWHRYFPPISCHGAEPAS